MLLEVAHPINPFDWTMRKDDFYEKWFCVRFWLRVQRFTCQGLDLHNRGGGRNSNFESVVFHILISQCTSILRMRFQARATKFPYLTLCNGKNWKCAKFYFTSPYVFYHLNYIITGHNTMPIMWKRPLSSGWMSPSPKIGNLYSFIGYKVLKAITLKNARRDV